MAFCMVPFSFGIALAIRMGISLPISVKRTQVIVLATLIFSALLFTDDAVKELADVVWLKVSLFNFNVAIFGILVGIATGLGKQWPLGVINFVFLWLFGLPMIYYTAVVQDQGLDAAWYWMNIPYLCMNVTLGILFVFTDWNEVQEQILDTG
eukprot:CAMPEP_0116112390 /NCGR_PEP_ID=MMETSP0327-20121206/18952_1 /TAXON_ID=44447 /ORGANISM="Pseudo-nitzschia delicatissima, Strain B596" /LENGTH=151 /DNA_ID=CAMNT_0003605683 /DNA_START=490 /DNA_END=941 /DNA_ORIENTATION=-